MDRKLLFDSDMRPKFVLRYVFFEELQPVLFAAEDENKALYICVLCDDRHGFRWIISPTKKMLLSKMMNNQCSVYSVFDASRNLGKSFIVEKSKIGYKYRSIRFSELPKEDLPLSGYMFDAEVEEVLDFQRSFMDARGLEQKTDGTLHYFRESIRQDSNNRAYLIGNSLQFQNELLQGRQTRFWKQKARRV